MEKNGNTYCGNIGMYIAKEYDNKDLRAAATRRNAVMGPTADDRRVGDDASDRVVMVSWWLLPRKVSVVDPGNFVGPTTRSPARLASPFPFLSLYLSLMGKTFQLFARPGKSPIAVSRSRCLASPIIILLIRDTKKKESSYKNIIASREITKGRQSQSRGYYHGGGIDGENPRERSARVHAPDFQALRRNCAVIMRQIWLHHVQLQSCHHEDRTCYPIARSRGRSPELSEYFPSERIARLKLLFTSRACCNTTGWLLFIGDISADNAPLIEIAERNSGRCNNRRRADPVESALTAVTSSESRSSTM